MPDVGKVNLDYKNNLTGAAFAFAGMNFMIDPADLPIESGQCVDICNCDIDYKNNVSRRNGFTSVYSGNVANGWANDNHIFCTLGGTLCYATVGISNALSLFPIIGVPTLQGIVEFKQVNDVVFFSDGITAGLIDGVSATVFETSYFALG